MKNNNINYNIIQNIKTIQNNLVLNKFDFFKELSIKNENFINFLKNIKNSKDFKSIQLKKNYKHILEKSIILLVYRIEE